MIDLSGIGVVEMFCVGLKEAMLQRREMSSFSSEEKTWLQLCSKNINGNYLLLIGDNSYLM